MDHAFVTDGQEPTSIDDGEYTKGATPFCGGQIQAKYDDLEHVCAMQRRGGPGSDQGNGRATQS